MINIYEAAQDRFAQQHYEAVVEQLRKKGEYTEDEYDRWFRDCDPRYSLRYVITARVEQLDEIRRTCEQQDSYPDCIVDLKNMYAIFAEAGRSIGDHGYNAVVLMERLRIRICPFCNRNHIDNVERPNRGTKRTSQLDHFFHKSKYPFLAMSFYNLVPSCYNCNHSKGTAELDLSPYSSTDLDPLIRFGFNIDIADAFTNPAHLSVTLTEEPIIRNNVDVLGLRDFYSRHNGDAFDVASKFHMYSRLKRKEVLDTLEGLYRDEDDLRDQLFGFCWRREHLKHQALAKLKKDVYEQLEAYERRGAGLG
ncbi:hypothetical protein FE782_02000 [Paenibacillus antri]|uniref:HNH endonuclease n=1 Tax=Paenibacillus antri TaxID=2582848 RepID=A0A5R9GED7_9BACL|nr:hypothetical protein [Paenibacillus antri]TLS54141.1 hypothetical protein FE782_02000 [Paenibacillus antri]